MNVLLFTRSLGGMKGVVRLRIHITKALLTQKRSLRKALPPTHQDLVCDRSTIGDRLGSVQGMGIGMDFGINLALDRGNG